MFKGQSVEERGRPCVRSETASRLVGRQCFWVPTGCSAISNNAVVNTMCYTSNQTVATIIVIMDYFY